MVTRTAPLGSVSSGTMRSEDLVPAFLDALESLDKEAHDKFVAANQNMMDVMDADDTVAAQFGDVMDEAVSELFDILDQYAPPLCYFGAHEGNGADYGFWVSWDAFENDVRDSTIVKVPAGNEIPADLGEDVEYVAFVTDHGKVTLCTPDGAEVWSVV